MEVDEEQHLVYESPASAVFNNFDLVLKILEEETDDIKNNMELRRLNRTFRDAYHVILRKTHQNLKIEYIYPRSRVLAPPRPVPISNDRIYINHCRFKIPNLDNYFPFLRNIVKVKIQSIVVKDLWRLEPSIRLSLYKNIKSLIGHERDSLKKLIGIDEICPENYEDSLWIPEKCEEYGPLRLEHLQESFTKPRVFETLIVPDYLLDDIANSCVESTQFREECLKAVSDFIPANISCKTLILKISEKRNGWIDPETNADAQQRMRMHPITDHQAMPREVMELMLKQWKVQSVVLKFVHQTNRSDYKGEWTRKDWFTRLYFKDSYIHINKSDPSLKIKEVLVDLTDSLRCNVNLRLSYVYNIPRVTYVDLPSIIRRVFSNDKLKILFSHYRISPYSSIARVAGGMMKIINADAPQNLEVEIINMYLAWNTDMDYFKKLTKQEPHLHPAVFRDFHISELPKRVYLSHRTFDRKNPQSYPIIKKEWVGRSFQLINKERNCTIKWTLFENENLLVKNHRIN
ncbi:hypothetical protein CAEBREN_09648 [Caenorhabditis brenneri]|uniref:Uncharacterized protein n=1 Tax=Caenorhabditis brenneri TaxID=135651 RepID=G0MLF5_CAEBE|nr:hypothetical protein CAEBREN_09648 [Caenorhabditis brenneri]